MPTPLRCDPKLFTKDLTGQVIIVTGANSGIGLETSRQLVKQGARVILACRNHERGEAAVKDAGGEFLTTLDLSSLACVKAFVDTFLSKYDRLDVLVNNAGVMACPYAKTQDDFEVQFGSNHLGHFYLMRLLTPILLKTAETTGKPSRFISLSSSMASAMNGLLVGRLPHANIQFDNLMWENTKYDEVRAYQQSKLANYLHAMEAAKRYRANQLISVAVHPGWVQTNLDVHRFRKSLGDGFIGKAIAKFIRSIFRWKGDLIHVVDGSQTTLYCVLEDADKMESGAFYSQIGQYQDPELCPGGWPYKKSINLEHATPENADKLWKISNKLVGFVDQSEDPI